MREFVDQQAEGLDVPQEDRDFIAKFYVCAIVGLTAQWIDSGMTIWDAQSGDVFYKGTSTKDLPVGVSVSYQLDGADISAEDLAGKSGKVTIRFDYTNNQYEMLDVDGKQTKIYVPFVMRKLPLCIVGPPS